MKIIGKVERDPPVFWDERGIGVLKLVEYEKMIRIKELQKISLPRELKKGDHISAEVSEGDLYYFLVSMTWGEGSTPNVSPPTATESPQTGGEGPKPPKSYTPTREKALPPTPGKGRACSARFMAKFQELVTKGLTVQELVDDLCLQESEIYALRQALEVRRDLEQRVRTSGIYKKLDTDFDTIRPSHYVELAKVPDPEKRLELARKVAEEHIPVKKLREEIEGPKPPPPRAEAIDTGPWTCPVCKQHYHLLHHPNGRHEFESVKVVEK